MYSKKEESILREQFWTTFGQYISPIPSAEGIKINWINYKTGIRFINVKMEVQKGFAYIGIEISHDELMAQAFFFEHFKLLQAEFEKTVSEKWKWERNSIIKGKEISRIYLLLNDVDIYKMADWPLIISFLKKRILLFDLFWCEHKAVFEMLA